MKLIVNTRIVEENIAKAEKLVNVPISLMFKDFYEDIFNHISNSIFSTTTIYGLHLPKSICYSANNAVISNRGAIIINKDDYDRCFSLGIREFYIPINAGDNREGLSIENAIILAKSIGGESNVHGLITSGCINEVFPSIDKLNSIYEEIKEYIPTISIGGSFWLSKSFLPKYVSDIRIGEYMLFGTIPYDDCEFRRGENAIVIEAEVIAVYPERKQFIIDCGYSKADISKCKEIDPYFRNFESISSEYSVFSAAFINDIKVGDTFQFIPDYRSLVTLRNANVEYIR